MPLAVLTDEYVRKAFPAGECFALPFALRSSRSNHHSGIAVNAIETHNAATIRDFSGKEDRRIAQLLGDWDSYQILTDKRRERRKI